MTATLRRMGGEAAGVLGSDARWMARMARLGMASRPGTEARLASWAAAGTAAALVCAGWAEARGSWPVAACYAAAGPVSLAMLVRGAALFVGGMRGARDAGRLPAAYAYLLASGAVSRAASWVVAAAGA